MTYESVAAVRRSALRFVVGQAQSLRLSRLLICPHDMTGALQRTLRAASCVPLTRAPDGEVDHVDEGLLGDAVGEDSEFVLGDGAVMAGALHRGLDRLMGLH